MLLICCNNHKFAQNGLLEIVGNFGCPRLCRYLYKYWEFAAAAKFAAYFADGKSFSKMLLLGQN